MKAYIDYMNELSPSDLMEGLLGHGMFAEKIPPVFSSEEFSIYYQSQLSAGKRLEKGNKWCDYIRYESIRNICIPRPLAIPNPFAYAELCSELTNNWVNLQSYFNTVTSAQSHKNSRIHIRKIKSSPSIFQMNYKNLSNDGTPQDELIKYSRYKVVADIANCFPSIYTHAIPWAIQGKATSKRGNKHWSNDIDKKIRNMKYGETSGILIGPHASNVISEIILCRIDSVLVNEGFQYFRCIDDYTCYCKTKEEAERFLSCLNKQLKEYELAINHKKTQITQLPNSSETDWVMRLNGIYMGNTYNANNLQVVPLGILKTYLDTAIRITIDGADAAPLNYVIKVISSKYLGNRAKEYYISKLKHLVFSYPYLATLMQEYVFAPFTVSKSDIEDLASAMYRYGFEHDAYETSSYALYWAIVNDITLNIESEDKIFATKDCVFMTLSYIYSCINKLDKTTFVFEIIIIFLRYTRCL